MEGPEPGRSNVAWLRLAGRRLRVMWLTKSIGTPIFMAVFFVAYFWILGHPLFPLTTIPSTFVDRMIPFQPSALFLYVSLWLYVVIAPALLETRRELVGYALAAVALSASGFAVFLFWPTTVPRPDAELGTVPSLAYLKAVDASGNAFPSLHVAFAVFSALWLARLLRGLGAGAGVRALNWAWCLGIVYSTVAIRQHVVLDAVSGGALGAAVAALHMRAMRPRPIS